MVVNLQVSPNLKNNKCRKMQARLDNKMVKVSNEKYIEHPKFRLLSKFKMLKKTPYPDVYSIMSFFPVSFFFQVLFVNGRVDQVSNNVSASLLPSNLLLGMDGAQYMAGQIDEV